MEQIYLCMAHKKNTLSYAKIMGNSNFSVYKQSLARTQPHLFVYIYRLWLLRCYSGRAESVQPRSSYCKASNIYYLAFYRNSLQTPTLVVVWKLYTLFCSFSGHPSIFFPFSLFDTETDIILSTLN